VNNTRNYAIGDIHGHLDKLRDLHAHIERDRRQFGGEGAIVHVGDLVDRGPDSAGVIDYLMNGVASGKPWIVLKGNHDRMFSYYLESPSRTDMQLRADLTWLDPRLGGQTTLASYDIDTEGLAGAELHDAARKAVPESHQRFLADLNLMYRDSGIAYLHAGIRPRVPLDDQTEDDLVWIRKEFLDVSENHEMLIVHGHTPVEEIEHHGNRINIDTGVAYGKTLSAIVAENGGVWRITPDGRSEIPRVAAVSRR
jgi:serine/threonine protein phosphatase 1